VNLATGLEDNPEEKTMAKKKHKKNIEINPVTKVT
jgi:hypothetical protein